MTVIDARASEAVAAGSAPSDDFPPISDNANCTLRSRYLIRDDDGNITETPDQLLRRVAKYLAEKEGTAALWEEEFYRELRALRVMMNSPTLMNAGRPLGQGAACVVLPIPDNIEGIMKGAVDTALVQRSGGGCG